MVRDFIRDTHIIMPMFAKYFDSNEFKLNPIKNRTDFKHYGLHPDFANNYVMKIS